MEHYHGEMHEQCKERFKAIDDRLNEGDKLMNEHTTEIAVIKTNVASLIKSINGLTKSLWGVCGTIVATLFGFFIWYIQSIPR